MRKVILAMQATLDGYVAGPNGELDWIFDHIDDELYGFICETLRENDTTLMGRVNYLEQAAYWPTATDALAQIVNGHRKIVFSRTLTSVEWQHSRLAAGTPAEEIGALKRLPGKNIGVTGGPTFVRQLLRDGLIDEIRLTIHPITLGHGLSLFAQSHTLTLIGSRRFDSGAVVNTYQAVRSWREAS
jgi:dihydrofolate reductase